jgi:hypothetical protein
MQNTSWLQQYHSNILPPKQSPRGRSLQKVDRDGISLFHFRLGFVSSLSLSIGHFRHCYEGGPIQFL